MIERRDLCVQVCVGLCQRGLRGLGVSLFGSLGLPPPARQGELSRFHMGPWTVFGLHKFLL